MQLANICLRTPFLLLKTGWHPSKLYIYTGYRYPEANEGLFSGFSTVLEIPWTKRRSKTELIVAPLPSASSQAANRPSIYLPLLSRIPVQIHQIMDSNNLNAEQAKAVKSEGSTLITLKDGTSRYPDTQLRQEFSIS